MKKILLTLIAALAFTASYAQFTKGRMLAGGNVSLSTSSNKVDQGGSLTPTSKSTSFQLSPNVGYFVIDNLAIGAGLGLGLSTIKTENSTINSKTNISSLEFEPFVRYYLKQGVFVEGQFGLGTTKYKYENSTFPSSTVNTTSWSIGAGYPYFLNDNVAIEPFLGYRRISNDNGGPVQSSLFLSVGLQVYLGSK